MLPANPPSHATMLHACLQAVLHLVLVVEHLPDNTVRTQWQETACTIQLSISQDC